MTPQTFGNRRIIWESKTKQVILVATCFLFTAGAIWTRDQYSTFSFWGTVAFFGGGGIGMLYRFLNPKNLFVTFDSAPGKKIMAEQFREAQADIGPFTYNETGFVLTESLGAAHYSWADVEAVFGYKEDEYVTDEICLDVFFKAESRLKITESTPGWYQFIQKLSEHFPSIPSDWHINIAVPVFETSLTLLFDKDGRTKEQAEAKYYK